MSGVVSLNKCRVPDFTISPQKADELCPWRELADEISLRILSFLNAHNLKLAGEACKKFDWLTNDESLWKSLYQRDYSAYMRNHFQTGSSYQQRYKELKAFDRNVKKEDTCTSGGIWFSEDIDRYRIYGNLVSATSISNNNVEISIWHAITASCIQRFSCMNYNTIEDDDNFLYVICDGRVEVFDKQRAEHVKHFLLEDVDDWCCDVIFDKNRQHLYTHSTIKKALIIWDMSTGTRHRAISFADDASHDEFFSDDNCLSLQGDYLISFCDFRASEEDSETIVENSEAALTEEASEEEEAVEFVDDEETADIKKEAPCALGLESERKPARTQVLNLKTNECQVINTTDFYWDLLLDYVIGHYLILIPQQQYGIQIYDLQSGKLIQHMNAYEMDDGVIERGSAHLDCFVTKAQHGKVKIWGFNDKADPNSLGVLLEFQGRAHIYTHTNHQIAVALDTGKIQVYDAVTKRCQTLTLDQQEVKSLYSLHIAGNRLTTFSKNREISVWCLDTQQRLRRLNTKEEPSVLNDSRERPRLRKLYINLVGDVLFLHAPSHDASEIEIFDITTGQCLQRIKTFPLDISDYCNLVGHRLIVKNELNRCAAVWDFGTALDVNAMILKQMISVGEEAETPQQKQDLQAVQNKISLLHSDIRRRITDNLLFPSDLTQVYRTVLTEVCLELLLPALQSGDLQTISKIMTDLANTHCNHLLALCNLLVEDCGGPAEWQIEALNKALAQQPQSSHEVAKTINQSHNLHWQWAWYAFNNVKECEAPLEYKICAVRRFSAQLRNAPITKSSVE